MLRTGYKHDRAHVNVLIQQQGLGDMCANLPALLYMCNQYTHVTPHIWIPDFMVPLYKNILPPSAIVRGYSEAEKKFKPRTTVATGISNHQGISSTKIHPVDYAFLVLLNEMPEIEHKNYPKVNPIDINHLNLPEKYVCISVGATIPAKVLPANIVNEVAKYVLKKGYTPVFLGSDKEKVDNVKNLTVSINTEVDYSVGINLCNKTSLLETASIIANSKCLVGMEGGLSHVAGLTDVPVVSSYTFADPQKLMPIRNNVLGYNVFPIEQPESLECRYCLSRGNFVGGKGSRDLDSFHNFSECYYDDYKCVTNLHPLQFILELDKIL